VLCNIATIVEITERSACCHDEADSITRDFAIFWNFKMACAKPKSETETEMSSRSRERASLDK
jgi:hypothetical protein